MANSGNKMPDQTISKGDEYEGFIVEDVTPVRDSLSIAYRMLHIKTGARVLHLHNNDPENLCALAFRTPPPDDTGLPHILEHTVLCGSKKYPVKDPFVEMLKTSLATFLNAMTYPDKTVYPCASMLPKDFFNLASVYCDSVLNPLLTKEHFEQEGHHLDFEKPGDISSPLTVKGIVYNEMKGVYSSLDGLISRETVKSICPDNAYGKDSGGIPDKIIELTYEDFLRYHHTYYHPSNMFVFLYGDIPTAKHLEFLNQNFLKDFDKISVESKIDPQPLWKEPRRYSIPYAVAEHESLTEKAAVCLTFLTNDVTDTIKTLAMRVLDYYLLDNAASPLRKALIDSHLGQELTSSGYADYQRDTFFTVGLKGTEPDRADKIEELIFNVLKKEVSEGLDKEKLSAAFHRLELSARQITGHYPLRLMDLVFSSWIYDADPLYNLNICSHLDELRKHYEKEDSFFEDIISEMILDNPHFTRLTFVPDHNISKKQAEAFQKKMKKIKAQFTEEELKQINDRARELERMQMTPNTPEALSTLPKLSKSDLSPDPHELDTTTEKVHQIPFLFTPMHTNELCYLMMSFDMSGIEDYGTTDLTVYLPLFAEAMVRMGTETKDYAQMAHEEALVTGGINAGVSIGSKVNDPDFYRPVFTLATNAINRNIQPMLDIFFRRLKTLDLSDRARLKDIILQGRMAAKSSLVPNGNHYAASYAAQNLSDKNYLSEKISGVTQVKFYESIASSFDKEQDEIVKHLLEIKDFMLNRSKAFASFVGDRKSADICLKHMQTEVKDLFSQHTPKPLRSNCQQATSSSQPIIHTLLTQTDISFVAVAMPAIPYNHELAPSLLLLSNQLSLGYLWEQIRVKHGAYGARAAYNPSMATFILSSYRDPKIKETLECYISLYDFIKKDLDLSHKTLDQAIIGTFKALDRPIRPSQAVSLALNRYMNSEDQAFRKLFRTRLLNITNDEVISAADHVLGKGVEKGGIAIISSKDQIASVTDELKGMGFDIKTENL